MEEDGLKEWLELDKEWRLAKAAHESAQQEVDAVMIAYLAGIGDPPSREMMDIVDNLCFNLHESRGALDQFMSEHAS
jgi:hypothetical protein